MNETEKSAGGTYKIRWEAMLDRMLPGMIMKKAM